MKLNLVNPLLKEKYTNLYTYKFFNPNKPSQFLQYLDFSYNNLDKQILSNNIYKQLPSDIKILDQTVLTYDTQLQAVNDNLKTDIEKVNEKQQFLQKFSNNLLKNGNFSTFFLNKTINVQYHNLLYKFYTESLEQFNIILHGIQTKINRQFLNEDPFILFSNVEQEVNKPLQLMVIGKSSSGLVITFQIQYYINNLIKQTHQLGQFNLNNQIAIQKIIFNPVIYKQDDSSISNFRIKINFPLQFQGEVTILGVTLNKI